MLDALPITVQDSQRARTQPRRVRIVAGELDEAMLSLDDEAFVGRLNEARADLDWYVAQPEEAAVVRSTPSPPVTISTDSTCTAWACTAQAAPVRG